MVDGFVLHFAVDYDTYKTNVLFSCAFLHDDSSDSRSRYRLVFFFSFSCKNCLNCGFHLL